VVVVAVGIRVALTTSWPWWDLDVYIEGARAVLSGRDLYAVEVHGLMFTYPPFAALAFTPLAVLGGAAGPVQTLISLAAYAVCAYVVAHRVRLRPPLTALIMIGALVLEPVVRTLVLGQVNLVLMALVISDLLLVRGRGRGVLLGLAAGIKLTPLVFVVYFLLKRDTASATRAVATFLATLALGWLVAPAASRDYWPSRLFTLESFGEFQVGPANQSLRAGLARLLHVSAPPTVLWGLLALVVLVLGAWVAQTRLVLADDVGAILALAIATLLVSPISWTHHWVWVLPALLYAVARGDYVIAWLVGAVFYIAPMWLLPSGIGLEVEDVWWELAISLTYVFVGLLGLLGLALRRAASRPVLA
jgi:alpha-1,2-mannosyltransferase